MYINKLRTPNMSRAERWIGAGHLEHMSHAMKDWPGPPIVVHGVPGALFVHGGGNYSGHVEAGEFGNVYDRAEDILRRMEVNGRRRVARWAKQQLTQCNMGFASLGDQVAEMSNGKRRDITWQKVGPTGVANVTSSLWRVGNQPAAGSAGSSAPGGRAPTGSGTTGAQFGLDDVSTDTRHIVEGFIIASVAGNNLLAYDRIFDVAKTMNSSATESVTGVPTRYQSSTPSAAGYAGGNFAFVEVGGTALAATAHNWTVCRYRNQAGTDTISFPSMTGNSSAIVDRLDHPVNSWFMPLASGDTGVMDLDQMQCSAAVATGAINFVIGHPLAWMPCPVANLIIPYDGVRTQVRVFDGAAIAFLEINKVSTTATTYNGGLTFGHG